MTAELHPIEAVFHHLWLAAANRGDTAQAALIEQASETYRQPPRPTGHRGQIAIWYANRGMRVFPLEPGQKRPMRGSHGVTEATVDHDRLTRWFGVADVNIGVATGDQHDVIDVDETAGLATFTTIIGDGAWLDIQGVTQTPRGLHLWVPAVAGAINAAYAAGVDYRGKGGYVVVPPSHVDGTLYRWLLPPAT